MLAEDMSSFVAKGDSWKGWSCDATGHIMRSETEFQFPVTVEASPG